jgi:hypothetical protein
MRSANRSKTANLETLPITLTCTAVSTPQLGLVQHSSLCLRFLLREGDDSLRLATTEFVMFAANIPWTSQIETVKAQHLAEVAKSHESSTIDADSVALRERVQQLRESLKQLQDDRKLLGDGLAKLHRHELSDETIASALASSSSSEKKKGGKIRATVAPPTSAAQLIEMHSDVNVLAITEQYLLIVKQSASLHSAVQSMCSSFATSLTSANVSVRCTENGDATVAEMTAAVDAIGKQCLRLSAASASLNKVLDAGNVAPRLAECLSEHARRAMATSRRTLNK